MVHYDHNENRQIILAKDTLTALSDEIADLMLLCGGDEDRVQKAILDAHRNAIRHYEAERGGESEGMSVFVDPQIAGADIVPLLGYTARA